MIRIIYNLKLNFEQLMGVSCVKPERASQKIGHESQTQHLEIVLQVGAETKCSGSAETMDQQTVSKEVTDKNIMCPICKDSYNRLKMAVIVCQESHTICSLCKDMLLASKQVKYRVCPYCKTLIDSSSVRANQEVMQYLQLY